MPKGEYEGIFDSDVIDNTLLFEDELIKLWGHTSVKYGKYLLVSKFMIDSNGFIKEDIIEESININELIDIATEYIKKNIEYKKGDRISSLMKLSALRK